MKYLMLHLLHGAVSIIYEIKAPFSVTAHLLLSASLAINNARKRKKNRKVDLVKLHMSIVPVIGFVELPGGETNPVGCFRTVRVEASLSSPGTLPRSSSFEVKTKREKSPISAASLNQSDVQIIGLYKQQVLVLVSFENSFLFFFILPVSPSVAFSVCNHDGRRCVGPSVESAVLR